MPNHGAGGRRKLPPYLHEVKGTHRADRHGPRGEATAKPDEVIEIPPAPTWLNDRSAEIFLEIANIMATRFVDCRAHVHMMSMAASCLWEVEHNTAVIEDLGAVYQTVSMSGSTTHKARPEVAFRRAAMARAESILSRFGLSPADLPKLTVAGGAKPKDDFDDF